MTPLDVGKLMYFIALDAIFIFFHKPWHQWKLLITEIVVLISTFVHKYWPVDISEYNPDARKDGPCCMWCVPGVWHRSHRSSTKIARTSSSFSYQHQSAECVCNCLEHLAADAKRQTSQGTSGRDLCLHCAMQCVNSCAVPRQHFKWVRHWLLGQMLHFSDVGGFADSEGSLAIACKSL